MGLSRIGVLGSEYIVARTPSFCTGLFPGSFERVPVAVSSRIRNTEQEVLRVRLTGLVNRIGDTTVLYVVFAEQTLTYAARRLIIQVSPCDRLINTKRTSPKSLQ